MKPLPPLQHRYRLRSVGLLALVFVLALHLQLYLLSGRFTLLSVALALGVGGPVGLLVGFFEVYTFPRLLTNRPLGLRLLLSAGLYLLGFGLLVWLGQHFVADLRHLVASNAVISRRLTQELTQMGLLATATELPVTRLLVLYGWLTLGVSIFYQTGRKIGFHSLLRVVLGQYNQPAEEQRLFLFADLKDSTVLAEQLGNLRYSAFIRDFFADVSLPIAASHGEVYQYVGDEVVVTWKWQRGLQQADCLRCFFAMQAAVERRRTYYIQRYGVMPTFKAGLHGGLVIATQVGAIKTDLVFHGDVLNTTARIQAQCNALHSAFLVSAPVLRALAPGYPFRARPLGEFMLRGKAQQVELFDVQPPAPGSEESPT